MPASEHFSEWDDEVESYKPPRSRGSRENIPDGTYQVEIQQLKFRETEKGASILWVMKVLNGHQKGKTIFHSRWLDEPRRREWAWNDLRSCGLEARSWSDALDNLKELNGSALEVVLKTKGQYQNVYFNDRIRTERLAEVPEEEVPF